MMRLSSQSEDPCSAAPGSGPGSQTIREMASDRINEGVGADGCDERQDNKAAGTLLSGLV